MSDDTSAFVGIITAGAALVTGALSSAITYVVSKRPAKAAEVTAEAAWQQAMNDGFARLQAQYDARNRELGERLERAEGALRDLVQHVESLEALLRRRRIKVPKRPPPRDLAGFRVVEGGKS